jgi:holliday junction DNA helicase RuvA
MIGSLRGRITAKLPPQLTLEVGGVGYEIEVPLSTFLQLPAIGEEVRLLTHLVVREDAHVLYGFGNDEERRLFRSLLKVSGIGPKIALALLSGMSVEAFARCIREQDVAPLVKVPGIGRKTAERLLIEMRDRMVSVLGESATAADSAAVTPPASSAEAEAFDALVALGYKPAEASRLLKAAGPGKHSTEEWIRRALQSAARE